MYARHLSLTDYRSWPTADIELVPGVNVLIGRNGTGKTNLVEALGYLATLSSHRVAADAPLIRRGAGRAVVRAAVVSDGRELLLEVEITTGRANRARINRAPLTRARDILGVLRTVLFAPEDLALVRGDPTERRKFLDEVLIMRAPRLAGVRADYDRVLKQRNALLKSAGAARRSGGDLSTLDVWDEHLAAAGAELVHARLDLVAALRPHVAAAYADVAGSDEAADLRYRSTVPVDAADEGDGGVARGVDVQGSDGPSPAGVGAGAVDPGGLDLGGLDPGGLTAGQQSAGGLASAGPGSDQLGSGGLGLPGPGSDRLGSAGPGVNGPGADARSVGVPSVGGPKPATPTIDRLHAAMLGELLRVRSTELDRGISLVGPHRDELELLLGGGPAKGYASHGESWSFALALRLGAFALLRSDGVDPVLVLDDVFAELDVGRRERLAGLVADADQVLITAAVPADVPAVLGGVRLAVTADGVGPAE